jgi:hypothetical protein
MHYILITGIHQWILLILTFYDYAVGRVQHHILNIIMLQAITNTILTFNIKYIINTQIICWTMGSAPFDMSSDSQLLTLYYQKPLGSHFTLKMETLRVSKLLAIQHASTWFHHPSTDLHSN